MSCSRRNQRSTFEGVLRTKIQDTASIRSAPNSMPTIGEMKMNATVLRMPAGINGQLPPLATAAPTRPPISARDDDDGMPYHQGRMFQGIAPGGAPSPPRGGTIPLSVNPLPAVVRP